MSVQRPLALLVLAAGKGTRMGGEDDAPPKVLVECLGAPLLEHVRRAVAPLDADETVVVTGHRADLVDAWMTKHWSEAQTALQQPQNGTGHATRLALEAIPDFDGDVAVLYGDVPQLHTADIERLLAAHRGTKALASLLTGVVDEPGRLGRVVRDATGRFERIVEAADADAAVLAIKEFNTGIYVFDAATLRAAVSDLSTANAQGEEYVTDAVGTIAAKGTVTPVLCADPRSLSGVNDWGDLATATALIRRRITSEHMARGVVVTDPDTTVIEIDVEIEAGAKIFPFTHIGKGCRIAAGAEVGPFARLRGGAVLEADAVVGNFVEVKGSRLGAGAKAKHLSYLGDADVGENANIGCGTITANYDGKNKHRTTIGPGASTGSGTVLVAPVTLPEGAKTGANAVMLSKTPAQAGDTLVGVPARVISRKSNEDGGSASDAAKEESSA